MIKTGTGGSRLTASPAVLLLLGVACAIVSARVGKSNPAPSYASYEESIEAQCGSDVPGGVALLRRGVDITAVDILNLHMDTDAGFKGPIVDYTCKEGKKWRSPHSGKLYEVPDQVWGLPIAEPTGWINTDTHTFSNYEHAKQFLARRFGLLSDEAGEEGGSEAKEGLTGSGMFSRSKSVITIGDHVMDHSSVVTSVSSFLSPTRIYLTPSTSGDSLKLGRNVGRALAALPDTYEKNKEGYAQFIRTFGTHHLTSAKVGPYMQLILYTLREYFDQEGPEEVGRQARASFYQWFSAHTRRNRTQQTDSEGGREGQGEEFVAEMDEEFVKSTTTKDFIYGGQPSVFLEGGLFEWLHTALDSPALISAQLAPLYTLIRGDPKRQQALKTATQVHLDGAYLGEAERILGGGIEFYSKGEGGRVKQLTSLQAWVRKESRKSFPSHAEVSTIAKRVQSTLSPPDWWTKGGTKLCFKYSSDLPGKFCSGQSPTCAPVGEFTSMFKDWSRGAGGCRLQWGLFTELPEANESDKWFMQTQFCFKHVPNGVQAQCGAKDAGEECVPVNEYTEPYHDHTDNRRGGCELAWSLSHPSIEDTPAWFANTKLCYRFQTFRKLVHGHMSQLSEPQCGAINEYYQGRVYEDNTMFRGRLNYREKHIQWAVINKY